MTKMQKTDIIVAGGGPTGMAACLAVAANGFSVVHVSPSGTHVDTDSRTTAIMMPGIDMLAAFGVWDRLEADAAPLRTLRMVDDTGRLLRAPTVEFEAEEIGEEAFGFNIRNAMLNDALAGAVAAEGRIQVIDATVSAAAFSDESVVVELSDGNGIEAKLLVGADGVHSLVRNAAEIEIRNWSYPQTALVLTFSHSRPHEDASTEFHTDRGPFTQVPLPGDNSSLVWVVKPDEIDELMAMTTDELSGAVEKRLHSTLGKVTVTSRPQAWPLSSLVAHRFAGNRVVLIGQAAHAFPPIGAQGLNLGLRDIEDLSNVLETVEADPGASTATVKYDRMRRADVLVRTASVDALNRSLLTGFLPVQVVRAAGLSVLKSVPALRVIAMREGMSPGRGLKAAFEQYRPKRPFRTEKDQPESSRSSSRRATP